MDLTGILQMCIWEHHGAAGENYFSLDQEMRFPGERRTSPAELVHAVATLLSDAQQGLLQRPAALARVAVKVAETLHVEICELRSGAHDVVTCPKDARVVHAALPLLAARFLDIEFTDGTTKEVAKALVQVGLTQTQMVLAIDGIIAMGTLSLWDRRPRPVVNEMQQRIQVNTAFSHVTPDQFRTLRGLALGIRNTLSDESRFFDVTSDFAHPESLENKLVDEGLVRSSICHADAMVVFTDHGRFGTAKSWARAEDLLMPVLVLSSARSPGDATVARFTGEFAYRTKGTYESAEHVVDLVRRFLEDNAGHIRDRHRTLLDYAQRDIGELQQLLESADVSTFDSSLIPWELVRFYLDSPVHWHQAPSEHRKEIERRLGYVADAGGRVFASAAPVGLVPLQRPGSDAEDLQASFKNLLRYAEIMQLPYGRVDQLVTVYHAERALELQLSERPGSYAVEDWRTLDRRTAGGQ